MNVNNLNKVYEDIKTLCLQSFKERYPSWISNSLTNIELELKKTLIEVQKLEELKKEIKLITRRL